MISAAAELVRHADMLAIRPGHAQFFFIELKRSEHANLSAVVILRPQRVMKLKLRGGRDRAPHSNAHLGIGICNADF